MAKLYFKKLSYDFHDIPGPEQTEDPLLSSLFKIISSWNSGQENFEMLTSGTTGRPRKIVFSKKQLLISANQTISVFGLNKNDVLLLCLPPAHVAGFMMVIRALAGGMNLVAEPPSGRPLKEIPSKSPTFASFVPNQIFNLINSEDPAIDDLNKMKTILVGGGIISQKLLTKIQQIKIPVYHTYGMTETLTHVAMKRINGPEAQTRFKPLPGIKFETGKNSNLVIHTPLYPGSPVETHDIVELFPDNSFVFAGRADHVINSGGIKIIPELLEEKMQPLILKFFNATQFFLFGKNDDKLGEQLVLAVETPNIQAHKYLAHFYEELKLFFNRHEIPKNTLFFNKFEYTELGKINKRQTIEKAKEQ